MKKFLASLAFIFLIFTSSIGNADVVISTHATVPSDIPNLILWVSSDFGITKDGANRVTNWVDRSSQLNNLFQSGGDPTKPIWSAIDGVTFDGVNQFLIFTNSFTLNLFTVFFVGVGPDPGGLVFGINNFNSYLSFNSFTAAGGPGTLNLNVDDSGTHRLFSASFARDVNPAIWTIRRNPTDTVLIDHNSLQVYNATQAGFAGTFGTTELERLSAHFYFSCNIKELIIFSSGLSDVNINLIESYLNGKYHYY